MKNGDPFFFLSVTFLLCKHLYLIYGGIFVSKKVFRSLIGNLNLVVNKSEF